MKSLLAECFGTFMLVLIGTGAIVINDQTGGALGVPGIALAFGLAVCAMIYAVGDISGAHLNPAVTLGFVLARRFPLRRFLPYAASQCAGAVMASGLLRILFPAHETLGATLPSVSAAQAFAIEFLLMLILMFVILSVATAAKEKGRVAGLMIGGVVGLEAWLAGPLTGASMNPARSLAPALISGHIESLWIYLLAPFLGAVAALLLCVCVRTKPCCRAVESCA